MGKQRIVGKFGKKCISTYTDTNCQRQLYIYLGNHDDQWIDLSAPVKIRSGVSDQSNALTNAGKEYEAKVYTALVQYFASDIKYTQSLAGAADMLKPVKMDPDCFNTLYDTVSQQKRLLLLEHQWHLTNRFIAQTFDITDGTIPTRGNNPTAINPETGEKEGKPRVIRPDLITIQQFENNDNIQELLPDGSLRTVSPLEQTTRWGINIIDIKHTPADNIGHRHFSEVLFYARSLSTLLEEYNLQDKFFVHANGNGILGRIELNQLTTNLWQKLAWTPSPKTPYANQHLLYQPVMWKDVDKLFQDFEKTVRTLWQQKDSVFQRDHRKVPLQIQPACGRCPYVDDCVESLSSCASPPNLRDETLNTSKWDIRLIPNIKPAIVHELHQYGIHTIEEMVNKLPNINFTEISPLYAEKETLYLKAKAIHTLHPAAPEDKNLFQSALLPHTLNMALVLNLETEQPHNIVFSYGVQLTISAPINSRVFGAKALNEAHVAWWNAWVNTLETIDFDDYDEDISQDALDNVDLSEVEALLDPERFATHHTRYFKPSRKAKTDADKLAEKEVAKEKLRGQFQDLLDQGLLRKMLEGLSALKQNETLTRKAKLGLRRNDVDVSYTFAEVSDSLDIASEYALFESLVEQLYHILNVCHATELLVIGQDDKGTYTHDFAGFYWSPQQMEHLLDLASRHYTTMSMAFFTQHSDTLYKFEQVQDFINPSASKIRNSQYHKKLYDIQAFFKQGLAFPEIISYSWHDLLTLWDHKFRPNRRFWAPLFNFMDFTVWYNFLHATNSKTKFKHYTKICTQVDIKLNGMSTILRKVHGLARNVGIIPSESTVVETSTFVYHSFSRANYNSIAKLWVGLHELNVSTAQSDTDLFRLTWPNFSIAKLKGAKVNDLHVLESNDQDKASVLEFFIPEMSSNVKISEGSKIQILNLEHRNAKQFWRIHRFGSEFSVTKIRWTTTYKGDQTGFVVHGHITSSYDRGEPKASKYNCYPLWLTEGKPEEAIFARLNDHETRYLFGTSADYWGHPMRKLLGRFNLGQSLLAELVAVQSGLRQTDLPNMSNLTVEAPEVYLYAPQLLPQLPKLSDTSLKTKIYHPPDASQRHAIQTTLQHPITCIQGPPGTGKSQTIVALIDDFVARFDRAPKILVSTFSYSALNVLVDKIYTSWEGTENNPQNQYPLVSKIPIILAGNPKRFDRVTTKADQSKPIVLSGSGKSWNGHHFPPEGEEPKPIKVTGGSKKRLFGNLLDAFGHDPEGGFILFSNGYPLQHIGAPYSGKAKNPKKFDNLPDDFGFDLIIIDEASQMPTNYMTSVTQLVKPFSSALSVPQSINADTFNDIKLATPPEPNDITRLVLVGDHNQLPPVSQVEPPEHLRHLIDSAFYYYLETHLGSTPEAKVTLNCNYRSHADIVTCITELGLYFGLQPFEKHFNNLKAIPAVPSTITQPWLKHILERDHVVNTLLHNSPLDTVFSKVEAELTIEVIMAFFAMKQPKDQEAEKKFWDEQLGVVSPHNAHGSLIIRGVQQRLTNTNGVRLTHLSDELLQEKLQGCVASVDKFQGSARDFIIGTMGISAEDQLMAEETFFYDINRFNVLISRAKSKMLLICSENFANYTPADTKVMPVASKIRRYVDTLCQDTGIIATSSSNPNVTFRVRTMPSTTNNH